MYFHIFNNHWKNLITLSVWTIFTWIPDLCITFRKKSFTRHKILKCIELHTSSLFWATAFFTVHVSTTWAQFSETRSHRSLQQIFGKCLDMLFRNMTFVAMDAICDSRFSYQAFLWIHVDTYGRWVELTKKLTKRKPKFGLYPYQPPEDLVAPL